MTAAASLGALPSNGAVMIVVLDQCQDILQSTNVEVFVQLSVWKEKKKTRFASHPLSL